MDRSLWISATGMEGQARLTETIANNLANVNTTAYKKANVHFQDLYYQTVSAVGADTSGGSKSPVGIDVGTGSRVSGITRDFTNGSLTPTSSQLDVAIIGDGFFEIQLEDGSLAYTRDGHFHRDAAGQIVTEDGLVVAGAPNIDANATDITITQDGTVTVKVNNETQNAGSFVISRFPNNEGLRPIGNNLFMQTDASGTVTKGPPNEGGRGGIRQSFLEGSNVEVVKEMVDMIAAQRAYEVISKSIKTSDEMLRTASQLK
ncbi:MAG: flagellar basal-body rod protein FlgG [Lentisphaeraceae bacterium]|nr:flagellar basal-body rod protein FlgG [Lentisphaeraceae bacterium]